MAHYVEETRNHLILRDGERVFGVEYRELGEHVIAEDMADLELLCMVGDDTSAVHLAAGANHSEDTTNGDNPAFGLLHLEEVFFPRVAVIVCRD